MMMMMSLSLSFLPEEMSSTYSRIENITNFSHCHSDVLASASSNHTIFSEGGRRPGILTRPVADQHEKLVKTATEPILQPCGRSSDHHLGLVNNEERAHSLEPSGPDQVCNQVPWPPVSEGARRPSQYV